MKLFHDYKPNGSVYYIVWSYFQERGTFRYQPLVIHEALRLLKIFRDGLCVCSHVYFINKKSSLNEPYFLLESQYSSFSSCFLITTTRAG